MTAVRLEDEALAYLAERLTEAGGLAAMLKPDGLWEPVVFLPDFADPLTLPDLENGGVASQEGADAELVSFLLFLKKRNGRLSSVLLDDPWAQAGDLDYDGEALGEGRDELLLTQGHVFHLYDMSALSPDSIWRYRAGAVSYLKIVYVLEMPEARLRALAGEEPDDLMVQLAKSVRHVAVNVHDDETWLIARYEPQHCSHCGHDHD